ncbi:hypothetical protein [Planctomyces sp. SH-PL14]|uniref:hypothetical protein n=1 Tax=Planctomyces sp. SH-PL14 TaxID=1632864 RepID=UPI00078C7DAD|nr:hypothetical protein [Planctomyces sp. SH-PL14]AMV20939.1 hypothetical protein VT03_23760 [Planctomyces sp. SH-PL14]
MIDPVLSLGFHPARTPDAFASDRKELLRYINLKLRASGLPTRPDGEGSELIALASGLLDHMQEQQRVLSDYRSPADQRIEDFLQSHFADVGLTAPLKLPNPSFILDRHGIARELSLPEKQDVFDGGLITSYRVVNGVLHNPLKDRRTTVGTFHVTEGGLAIADDKKAVPKATFAALFQRAVAAPPELLVVPFSVHDKTASMSDPDLTRTWTSLLLRPVVQPEVPGFSPERSMEVRFFAPGMLVSNADFVESIFGNAGDPFISANDSGLDFEHWSGHTGCIILAPHLTKVLKKDVGLPHTSKATERQKRDGMCWDKEDELYNGGEAFKITCRTEDGVIVTLISDSYYGYCKKEIKTQISYATNLMGNAEEEHAGGALCFPSWNLGDSFQFNSRRYNGATFDEVSREYAGWMDVKPEGYGVDKFFPELFYIPEDALADIHRQTIVWKKGGSEQSIPLLPGRVYMSPSGYKLRMEKHPGAPSWRLIGTAGEGIFIHKPCTVSGGGKSEISKSLVDYMQYGSVYVADYENDMKIVESIFERDNADRWKSDELRKKRSGDKPSRPILSKDRSLGSVIKLLTPSDEYSEAYNKYLKSIPDHIYAIVFAIKRFYQPDWGSDWRKHFTVDVVNGSAGHELKVDNRRIVGTYLRVGITEDNGWRTFKVRQDFAAAAKVQTEDDISASVVVPPSQVVGRDVSLTAAPTESRPMEASSKFVINCEYRLFQRPDDAIHRGLDKQAEADLARRNVNFISNYEPLTRDAVEQMVEKVVDFDAFTPPVKDLLQSVTKGESGYVVCSANPRRIGGGITKNPRYLQDRPDMVVPLNKYVAEMGTRLFRKLKAAQPVHMPVDAVLSGRRNNPPEHDKGIRSLAVYAPLHYQELPELFMDFICSLTGKSPSTTGAGSEGSLTKGPFNALLFTSDLNAALLSALLTGVSGYSTAAGHIGPHALFEHDISLLMPEVWSRLSAEERDPKYLIREGLLKAVPDFKWAKTGQEIPARRLGYRITDRFVRQFFGRVFDNPDKVFNKSILEPETQDEDSYADGILYIMEAYERVAKQYFEDDSIEEACPPLKALLSIMAHGKYEGKDERDPSIRAMFTKENVLKSDWYQARLTAKQRQEVALWSRKVDYLRQKIADGLARPSDLENAQTELQRVSSPAFLQDLIGTLGRQPTFRPSKKYK